MSSSSESNVAHFDEAAKTWAEEPRRIALGEAMAGVIAEAIPLTSDTRALDFGCGVGLVCVPLAPKVGSITAADTSLGMLAALEARVRELGITNIMPRTLPTDALEDGAFDFVYTCMVLHHVADVEAQLQQFAAWCAPGGWLLISDLETEDGTFHGADAGPVHHGFDPRELAKQLEGLGFTIGEAQTIHTLKRDRGEGKDKEYPLFMLTARKGVA